MNTSRNTIEIVDRRSRRRIPSCLKAALWVGDHRAKIGVIETTIDGARLMVRELLEVGDVVELLVGDSIFIRKARVAWTLPLSVSDAIIAGFSFFD